ncbi:MAG: N-acetylglucosamine-6-phosphate deacetylase [Burkholderiales bacterium]|nr:N-acetylglucosamine-6-phosphate deacetylase [Burkholderiales bacterium]
MTSLHGDVLTPTGWIRGRLDADAASGRIAAIHGAAVTEAEVRSTSEALLIPGFVDLHVHGGGGADIMDGADAARTVAATHLRTGTTTLLATTMTAPRAELERAFAGIAAVSQQQGAEAYIAGVHLEGPFISEAKLGAQPNFTRAVTLDEVAALHSIVPIRVLTLAPDVPGQAEVIPALTAIGIRVQLGHTDATYENARAALAAGATGFTHLFNAMSGLHHRAPGVAGAALAHAAHAEIIPDLLHVHPGAIRVALRCIAGLYCVTDSTAAAGMPDGEYRLGRQLVTRCMGGVRLADGTLAGSVLTMEQAFRNLVNVLGLDLAEASRRTATVAADYVGLHDRGRLAVGAVADVLTLDRDLTLRSVMRAGRLCD